MNDKENEGQKGDTKDDLLSELQSVIKNIVKKEGYITHEISTTRINLGVANYLGELFEVDVKGKSDDGEKETNLFVKKAISEGVLSKLVGVYVTENYVYHDLAKRFHELQNTANVPEEDRYKMVKCYENSESTTIILENMAKKAFKSPHRMEVVSLKLAEMCIEQLAKFHSLSFALKIKDSAYFESKVRHIKYTYSDKTKALCEATMKMTVRDLDPIYKAKAEKVKAIYKIKHNSYKRAENASITCLCHGDFKPSNILMRENKGEVAEVIPVDYQLVHVGCPVNDFLSFIAFGTDRKFRAQHFENLKTLYYEILTNFLIYFDIDSNDVFPRNVMDELFRQRMDYIAVLAVFGFPFIFAPDNALNVKDLGEANIDLDERYKERLMEILDDIPV